MLSERAIWTLILRCVSREDGVYFLSHDIDQMDDEDLRRAAMGRYRRGHLLEQNCLKTTPEVRRSDLPILTPASKPITLPSTITMGQLEDGDDEDSIVSLIPGGR